MERRRVRRPPPARLRYLHHGVDDAGQVIRAAWSETALRVLQPDLDDPDAVILRHCHMGLNRGPSLGFALLLAQAGVR